MSLADNLLNDFSDDDFGFEEKGLKGEENLDSTVNNSARHNQHEISDLLKVSDLTSIETINEFCPILPKLYSLKEKLTNAEIPQENQKAGLSASEQQLLADANNLISEMNTYFNVLITFIKTRYSEFWPDLFTIIKNPLNYVKLIQVVKFDLSSLKEMKSELEFLPKDQILSLTMSSNFLVKLDKSVSLSQHTQKLILEACEVLSLINQAQVELRSFLTKRVSRIAPNLTELVGAIVASQLISTLSLENLCATPACNISSIGKSLNHSEGYITQCELVKNSPEEFKTQALRQVSAKVVLAARVDLGAFRSGNFDSTLGLKWKHEIKAKLDKLMLPPENVQIKPLPIPVDMKSKKRGGRKFKKMRERMKMSEVEKAQNKMVFGEKEVTRIDASGEEIGLGMLGKTSIRSISNLRGAQASKGTQKQLESFTKITKPDSTDGSSKLSSLL